MNTTFKTEVDISVYEQHAERYLETKKVQVEWSIDLEMRGWGIKGFGVSVPEQKITVLFTEYNEQLDEDVETEVVLGVKDVEVEFEGGNRDILAPLALEFFKGKWKLVF